MRKARIDVEFQSIFSKVNQVYRPMTETVYVLPACESVTFHGSKFYDGSPHVGRQPSVDRQDRRT